VRFAGCIVLALVLVPGPAAAAPSFDCGKAASAVEKALCLPENEDAAYRDAVLAALYKEMKEQGGYEEVLAGQPAWLKLRNACGADTACLTRQYDTRIAELAKVAGDETGVTGSYAYEIKYDPEDTSTEPFSDVGDAFVYRDLAGQLHGYISTVSGPTFHICEIGLENAEAMGDAWLFTDSEENKDYEGRLCRVLIRQEKQSLRIDSIGCGNWCGARGYFDNTYVKLK
jgi:uncharacterized protein